MSSNIMFKFYFCQQWPWPLGDNKQQLNLLKMCKGKCLLKFPQNPELIAAAKSSDTIPVQFYSIF